MECDVCCRESANFVKCEECRYQACCSCVQTYLISITSDPHCMNCRQSWDILFLRKNLEKTFLEGVFQQQRKKILWKRSHRCRDSNVLCICPSCPCGKILKSTHTCVSCWIQVCPQCHGQTSPDHKCPEEEMKSLEMITQITRQCPGCHVPIEKKSGCFQMFCTHCYTAFDWKHGNVLDKTRLHNPHYFEHQKQTLVLDSIVDVINNMTDYSLKWMCREFYILILEIGRQVKKYHPTTCVPDMNDLYQQEEMRQQRLCQYLLWNKYHRRGLAILYNVMTRQPQDLLSQIQCFQNDLKEILIEYNEHVADCVQLRGYRLFPCNPPLVCI